jgi:hypothetical protein
VDVLDRALRFAYAGSAEHGATIRPDASGEFVPSPFMVLDELRDALRALSAVPDAGLRDAIEYACNVMANHRDVAATAHVPIIQGYIDALRALSGETGTGDKA